MPLVIENRFDHEHTRPPMIVTIDGPAGAGKSHVSRMLAERLHFHFLDTGATYRAVVLAALRRGVKLDDADALAQLSGEISIEFDGELVTLDGQDVTADIRSTEVTSVIHFAADNATVRENLVKLQRRIAANKDIVTEGRDQGTVAFPNAECKIFLTATPRERARRRLRELTDRGESSTFEEVLARQNDRDQRDASRPVGRLVKADDAVEVITDGLTQAEVVDRLEKLVAAKRGVPS